MHKATGAPGFGGDRKLKGNTMKKVKAHHRKAPRKMPVPRSATFSDKNKGNVTQHQTFMGVSKRQK